jgi:hypothetical protein
MGSSGLWYTRMGVEGQWTLMRSLVNIVAQACQSLRWLTFIKIAMWFSLITLWSISW